MLLDPRLGQPEVTLNLPHLWLLLLAPSFYLLA